MNSAAGGSRSHYEVLGVAKSADVAAIRQAYRQLARQHHPDRHGGRTTTDMVRINEAWHVLSDPQRRLRYDEALDGGAAQLEGVEPRFRAASPTVHQPARFPWKFVLGFFAFATAAILLVGVLTDPGSPQPIDNIIRVGSCVDVDIRIQEAREVSCDGPSDAHVVSLVPFDGRCPAGTDTFRDRQGLGLVCTKP